jgi:hypothetical protein
MSNYTKSVRYAQGDQERQYWRSPDGINRENVRRFASAVATHHHENCCYIEENDANIYVVPAVVQAEVYLPPLAGVRNGQRFLIQRIGGLGNSVVIHTRAADPINETPTVEGIVSTLTLAGQCVCFKKVTANFSGTPTSSWHICTSGNR